MNNHLILRKLNGAKPFLKRIEDICATDLNEFLNNFDLQHFCEEAYRNNCPNNY